MKYGIRQPSITKSISARTTGKATRQIKSLSNPLYGKKGIGIINNPSKALYNKTYNKTSLSASKLLQSTTSTTSKSRTSTHKYNTSYTNYNIPVSYDTHLQASNTDTNNHATNIFTLIGSFFLSIFNLIGSILVGFFQFIGLLLQFFVWIVSLAVNIFLLIFYLAEFVGLIAFLIWFLQTLG